MTILIYNIVLTIQLLLIIIILKYAIESKNLIKKKQKEIRYLNEYISYLLGAYTDEEFKVICKKYNEKFDPKFGNPDKD